MTKCIQCISVSSQVDDVKKQGNITHRKLWKKTTFKWKYESEFSRNNNKSIHFKLIASKRTTWIELILKINVKLIFVDGFQWIGCIFHLLLVISILFTSFQLSVVIFLRIAHKLCILLHRIIQLVTWKSRSFTQKSKSSKMSKSKNRDTYKYFINKSENGKKHDLYKKR